MNWLVFWLVAIVTLGVIEIFTFQLVAVWPAIGGVCALLACTLQASVPVQFIVFIAVSILLLILTRPMVRRFLDLRQEHTNADRLLEKSAIVTEDIDNLEATGTATVSGVTWIARSADGSPITKGEKVKINQIEGTKLIVSRLPVAAEKK